MQPRTWPVIRGLAAITAFVLAVAAPSPVRAQPAAATNAAAAISDADAARAAVDQARRALDSDDFLRRLNESTRRIAEAVEPSIVHVAVGAARRRGGGLIRLGQGSGWLYDEQGHVVTNAHVVEDAPRIIVQLHDGRQVRATRVGADEKTDIAVIRLEDTDHLVPARRATGEEPRQGDRVYAFGSPFGFKFSMSEGIVSGLARDPGAGDGYTNYIQSDAAVNPGNSGGPLVDIRGRVVGMNVAIATGSNPEGGAFGQSAGISFAIPLATIEPVVEQLIATGKVSKGYLGISMALSEEENAVGLEEVKYRGPGVVIGAVVEEGPAANAGLRERDVITAIAGQPVANIAQLRATIAFTPPGKDVRVTVWREGSTREVSVKLGDLDTSRAEVVRRELAAFGLTDLDEGDTGATVRAVRAGSPAAESGFKPGSRITHAAGIAIKPGSSLVALLADLNFPNQTVTARVRLPGGEEKDLTLGTER